MHGKDEAKQLRSRFYNALGFRMKKHVSASGLPVRWTNYRTGVKDVFFRLDADRDASLSIELQHKDAGIRELIWEQFREMRLLLEAALGEDLYWEQHVHNSAGQAISRISISQRGLSLFRESDWPELLDFLEQKLLALDELWADIKVIFEDLSS